MVRFSDLLGGSGDPDDVRPTTLPNPVEPIPEVAEDDVVEAPAAEVSDEAEVSEGQPDTGIASPEDVLDRLTQYATSARTDAPVEPVATDEPIAVDEPVAVHEQTPDEFIPVGDDLLPRSKGPTRRSRKRRP